MQNDKGRVTGYEPPPRNKYLNIMIILLINSAINGFAFGSPEFAG